MRPPRQVYIQQEKLKIKLKMDPYPHKVPRHYTTINSVDSRIFPPFQAPRTRKRKIEQKLKAAITPQPIDSKQYDWPYSAINYLSMLPLDVFQHTLNYIDKPFIDYATKDYVNWKHPLLDIHATLKPRPPTVLQSKTTKVACNKHTYFADTNSIYYTSDKIYQLIPKELKQTFGRTSDDYDDEGSQYEFIEATLFDKVKITPKVPVANIELKFDDKLYQIVIDGHDKDCRQCYEKIEYRTIKEYKWTRMNIESQLHMIEEGFFRWKRFMTKMHPEIIEKANSKLYMYMKCTACKAAASMSLKDMLEVDPTMFFEYSILDCDCLDNYPTIDISYTRSLRPPPHKTMLMRSSIRMGGETRDF